MASGTSPDPSGLDKGVAQGASRPAPQDVTRRLDGLRGWLAEIDRSLRRRSVVVLVLTALAIGAGAAAIYISLTKNAETDRIDALETRIENLEAAAAGVADTTDTTTEEPLPATPATEGTDSTVPEGSTAPDAGVADEGASGGTQP
ncbi:MAG: hypothetical protein ACO3CR_05160 [Solirubrobacterales bacterium]